MIDFTAHPDQRDVPAIRPLKFWLDHEPSGKPGEFREVEYVEWAKKGTNSSTKVEKIAHLKKRGAQGQINPAWPVIEPYYDAWKKGQEEPTTGTPLSVLPFLTKGQVEHYRLLNIRSAEDLARVSEGDFERMGMGARKARDQAAAYVQAKQNEAVVAAHMAEVKEENAALKAQIDELTKAMNQLTANMPKRDKPRNVAE